MKLAVALFLSALLPGFALAAPKMIKVKQSGVQFQSPKGWELREVSTGRAYVEQTDGKASLRIEASYEGPPADLVTYAVPGAKQKKSKGWVCAEGVTDDARWTVGACAKTDRDGVTLVIGLSADKKTWKKLGGMKLMQKVAVSAKGFSPVTEDTSTDGGWTTNDGGWDSTNDGTKTPTNEPPASNGWDLGIYECDSYFARYASCMATLNLGASDQKMVDDWIDQTKASFRPYVDTADGAAALVQLCQDMDAQSADAMRAYGCAW